MSPEVGIHPLCHEISQHLKVFSYIPYAHIYAAKCEAKIYYPDEVGNKGITITLDMENTKLSGTDG